MGSEKVSEFIDKLLNEIKELKIDWDNSSTLRDIAAAMATVGRFDEALEVASKIKSDYWGKESLRNIISEMARAGKSIVEETLCATALDVVDNDKFGEILNVALAITKDIETGLIDIQKGVKILIPKMGFYKQEEKYIEALRKARRIKNVEERDSRLADVAISMAESGLCDRAMSVVEEIEWDPNRLGPWVEISAALAKDRRFDEALSLAQKIEDESGYEEDGLYYDALSDIATEMARVGNCRSKEIFRKAIRVEGKTTWGKELEEILQKQDQSIKQKIITEDFIEAIRFDEALRAAKKIKSYWYRSSALRDIAEAIENSGSAKLDVTFEEALEDALNTKDPLIRIFKLRFISASMVNAGRLKVALSVAKMIKEYRNHSATLMVVTDAMAKAGNHDEALKEAKKIEIDEDRECAIGNIAITIAKNGKFDEALIAAKEIENHNVRASVLGEIAKTLVESFED